MKEVIHIEPPRLDAYGRPIPDRFLFPVRVEVRGDIFYIGEKFYFFYDIEGLIETVKTLEK